LTDSQEMPALETPPPEGTPRAAEAAAGLAESVLSARDVRKAFKIGERSIEVLHGARLELRRAERLCLMGASGAGKSTFLHVLGLLEEPTEGEVWVQGRDAWKLPMGERAALRNRHFGFVFQAYHLLPDLTALENVTLPARIAHSYGTLRFDKARHMAEASELLERFGLGDRLGHRPSQLSGGERQRVAIARALFLGPDILIADEPTGNLDTATGQDIMALFDKLREAGHTIILVTHEREIADHARRTIKIRDGQIESDERRGAQA